MCSADAFLRDKSVLMATNCPVESDQNDAIIGDVNAPHLAVTFFKMRNPWRAESAAENQQMPALSAQHHGESVIVSARCCRRRSLHSI